MKPGRVSRGHEPFKVVEAAAKFRDDRGERGAVRVVANLRDSVVSGQPKP